MPDKEFLDTNIVFDAFYTARQPFSSMFHKKFEVQFLLKQLYITVTTSIELQNIAVESAQLLVIELYNKIRPLDWDNLDTDDKNGIIKEIHNNLNENSEIIKKNRKFFVLSALKEVASQLQNLNKKEMTSSTA